MQRRIGASTSPSRVKLSGVVDLNVSLANVIAGEFEVVMQRVAQFLARLRDEVGKRIEAFFRDDHASKSDSDASAQQHSNPITRGPVWDAWSWPEPRVRKRGSLPEYRASLADQPWLTKTRWTSLQNSARHIRDLRHDGKNDSR